MRTSRQHLANELYKWKFSEETIFRFRRSCGGRKPQTRRHGSDLLSYCSGIHAGQRCLSLEEIYLRGSAVKLLWITTQGKWNQPPTVRKMLTVPAVYAHVERCRPELIPRNMDALPACAQVRLACGVHVAPPTACVRAFGRMHPCNEGALFTWSTASMTHCHFHSSFYFSCSSWGGEWEVRVHVYAFFFLFSCLLTPLPSLFSFPHL